jgi:SM-20-related protein
MIDLTQIGRHTLQTEPYEWAEVNNLFSPIDGAALASSFPRDHFKTVVGYGGEKDYEYDARALVPMGSYAISYPEELSKAWLSLTHDLLSPEYRVAMSLLTGCDLTTVPMEINVFHYGPRTCLGPHPDLGDKLATHVLYFNRSWNGDDGGCLTVLRSGDPTDVAAEIAPIVGNSAVLVRSEKSWHAVSRVANDCPLSRRSLTATFYRHGSVSTLWPPDDMTPLHRYNAADLEINSHRHMSSWARWRSFVRSAVRFSGRT